MNQIEKYMYVCGAVGVIINIPIFFSFVYYNEGLSLAISIPLNIILFVIESAIFFIVGMVIGAIIRGVIKK